MNNKNIFIAFLGPEIEQDEKIFVIGEGFECWNLKKFEPEEFIERIVARIPPVHDGLKERHYLVKDDSGGIGVTEKKFGTTSWGLLIPDAISKKLISGYGEILFLLNLYSPHFLHPVFHVDQMGVTDFKSPSIVPNAHFSYFHNQKKADIFKTKEFISFFKKLLEQSVYSSTSRDHWDTWNKEEWRLFIGVIFYSELEKYEYQKEGLAWQREAVDMMTIMETLFTADNKSRDEVGYRLRKRLGSLLANYLPDIEIDIKKLYDERSEFVHGSLFAKLAKESVKLREGVVGLPLPDFNFYRKHKEYVRFALVAYLFLALKIKEREFSEQTRVIDLLEAGIVDIGLRKRIVGFVDEIFSLLPKDQFNL